MMKSLLETALIQKVIEITGLAASLDAQSVAHGLAIFVGANGQFLLSLAFMDNLKKCFSFHTSE